LGFGEVMAKNKVVPFFRTRYMSTIKDQAWSTVKASVTNQSESIDMEQKFPVRANTLENKSSRE